MAFDLVLLEKDKEKSHSGMSKTTLWLNREWQGVKDIFCGLTERCCCFNNSQNHWCSETIVLCQDVHCAQLWGKDRFWSVNPLSSHLPPATSEFLNFYLLIDSFFLAYINVNTEKDDFPPEQVHFLSVLVVLPVLQRQLLVSRLASWKTVCGYKRAKPGLSTWIWGGLLRILGHFASVQNYFKA